MRIFPTVANSNPQTQDTGPAGSPVTAYTPFDLSELTPDEQFAALSTILELDDAANPAPNTGTPPFGESIPEAEYISDYQLQESYLPMADVEAGASDELLSIISDAAPMDGPEWTWENDPQYYGLGVPPGVPNYGQPIETGHSQIILPNPGSEVGWDAWSGKPMLARVARHENLFLGYSAGTNRGHGVRTHKVSAEYAYRTQQARDLLLSEIQRRGIHNVVIDPNRPDPYTDQVAQYDTRYIVDEPEIGPEGVLP